MDFINIPEMNKQLEIVYAKRIAILNQGGLTMLVDFNATFNESSLIFEKFRIPQNVKKSPSKKYSYRMHNSSRT